jgi:hypothetical protein
MKLQKHSNHICFSYLKCRSSSVPKKEQRGVASADYWNWGNWWLMEYKWKGSFPCGSWGSWCRYKIFASCLGCSSQPSICVYSAHTLFVPIAQQPGQAVVLGRQSFNMCLWVYLWQETVANKKWGPLGANEVFLYSQNIIVVWGCCILLIKNIPFLHNQIRKFFEEQWQQEWSNVYSSPGHNFNALPFILTFLKVGRDLAVLIERLTVKSMPKSRQSWIQSQHPPTHGDE